MDPQHCFTSVYPVPYLRLHSNYPSTMDPLIRIRIRTKISMYSQHCFTQINPLYQVHIHRDHAVVAAALGWTSQPPPSAVNGADAGSGNIGGDSGNNGGDAESGNIGGDAESGNIGGDADAGSGNIGGEMAAIMTEDATAKDYLGPYRRIHQGKTSL
jgi:hypothetical protein